MFHIWAITEVNLRVPGLKALDEDILVVIQNDSMYSAKVPVTLGTLHIDMVVDQATPHELAKPWSRMADRYCRSESQGMTSGLEGGRGSQ